MGVIEIIWIVIPVLIFAFLCYQRRKYYKFYKKNKDVKNARYLGF